MSFFDYGPSGIKSATSTVVGATTQGALNALTGAEELFNENIDVLKKKH